MGRYNLNTKIKDIKVRNWRSLNDCDLPDDGGSQSIKDLYKFFFFFSVDPCVESLHLVQVHGLLISVGDVGSRTTLMSLIGQLDKWKRTYKEGYRWFYFRERVLKMTMEKEDQLGSQRDTPGST